MEKSKREKGIDMMSDNRDADRLQSKVDDAFIQINECLVGLTSSISTLEHRTSFVMNDHPRPPSDAPIKSPVDKPNGDSALLVRLHTLSIDLNNEEGRIRTLVDRFDI